MRPRAEVIAKARELAALRIPFQHGQASRAGCDCVGLLRLVANELGLFDATDANPAVREFIGYGRDPVPERMRKALDTFLVPVKPTLPGDVLWLIDGDQPRHLAILDEGGIIIHASQRDGFVVRTRIVQKIVGVWSFPGVA